MRDTAGETATPTGPMPVGRRGRTMVADRVLATIVGRAAREVDGVHDLGGGEVAPAVSVAVVDMQAVVDLQIVADHGIRLTDLSAVVRRNVVAAVESMTGLHVTEVNVAVTDLHVPDCRGA